MVVWFVQRKFNLTEPMVTESVAWIFSKPITVELE